MCIRDRASTLPSPASVNHSIIACNCQSSVFFRPLPPPFDAPSRGYAICLFVLFYHIYASNTTPYRNFFTDSQNSAWYARNVRRKEDLPSKPRAHRRRPDARRRPGRGAGPVSYTHLDVYKRQRRDHEFIRLVPADRGLRIFQKHFPGHI